MNAKLEYRKYERPTDDVMLAELRRLYLYESSTGHLLRRATGKPAGHLDGKGYRSLCLLGQRFKLHRLIWLMQHGVYPTGLLDHVNGDRMDNRIENLRIATDAQNVHNRIRRGEFPVGVSQVKRRFCARIQIAPGKKLYLGYYDTPEEAAAAYAGASIVLHGDYASKLSRAA